MKKMMMRVVRWIGLHECVAWECRTEVKDGWLEVRCVECGRRWRWAR